MRSNKDNISNKNNTSGNGNGSGGRYGSIGRKPNAEPVSWGKVPGPAIKDAIGFVTQAGDAITFGRTSDGGALSVTVLSREARYKFYASTVAEAEEMLMGIIEASGT